METTDANSGDAMLLPEVWARVFNEVRRDVAMPTVWLAMQAAVPLVIDGHYFVAALPPAQKYLALNLQDAQASAAIEAALQQVTGRVLAFTLIEGETLADWQAQKPSLPKPAAAPPAAAQSAPVQSAPAPPAALPPGAVQRPAEAPRAETARAETPREVYPTWEKLNERLAHGYKTAPQIRYAHGQARYILEAVRHISDTIDVLMPGPGQPRDDQQERMLSKTLEKFSSVVTLDPLFLSLELWRYREAQGKDVGL